MGQAAAGWLVCAPVAGRLSLPATMTIASGQCLGKNGPSANALMAKVIANLNGMIQMVPTVVLGAHYPERLSDELHIYEACEQHMHEMDIIVYADKVNALNHTLMRQAILFLSPQWFHRMTTFMCQEYVRIHNMHNSCKAIAFEKAHYAHRAAHGLSEDDDVFLTSLKPRLWILPNGTIIPDWEVPMDKAGEEMAHEDPHWGSDDDLGELGYPTTGYTRDN
ncbi:hypothetical protein IW261DRAFT_1424227 [Armillaria novae-zelandiae]|uniref:Uncharacterized protein n=1 Tax=Armillaria novae-zelandiae TaxID=153914 RepID=A0AA39NVG1_9AGAR|nr:hypothetical protein IW261DRAFT_1424227 [Armillaria novae-zelandiae]